MQTVIKAVKILVLGIVTLLSCLVIGLFIGIDFLDIGTKGPAIAEHLVARENQDTMSGQRVNVLVMGIDARPGEGQTRSDTNMLFSLDPRLKKALIISIPRDTKVNMSGEGSCKFAEVHALGGAQKTVNQAEVLLNTHIDHYAEINFESFAEIIDILGGVTIDVEQRMYKPSEGIDLQPGEQRLNGKDALGYVRFRGYPNADITRGEKQQKFVKAMAQGLRTEITLSKIPLLIQQLGELLVTDMSNREMIQLALWGMQVDQQNIITQTLPGTFEEVRDANGNLQKSFWLADRSACTHLLADLYADHAVSTFSGTAKVERQSAAEYNSAGAEVSDTDTGDKTAAAPHQAGKAEEHGADSATGRQPKQGAKPAGETGAETSVPENTGEGKEAEPAAAAEPTTEGTGEEAAMPAETEAPAPPADNVPPAASAEADMAPVPTGNPAPDTPAPPAEYQIPQAN